MPTPGAGQIQVKVEYASVNPIDWKIFSGAIHGIVPCAMPYTPGFDIAGTVSAVGEGKATRHAPDVIATVSLWSRLGRTLFGQQTIGV